MQKMRHLHHQLGEGEEDYFAPLLLEHSHPTGIVAILASVSLPVLILIAEVVTGRYKLASCSLKAMWLLSVAGSLISVCENHIPLGKSTLFSIQLFLIALPQYFLLGAFTAVAVPLAIDQIISGSDANISAFIHWLGWTYICGITIPGVLGSVFYNCSNLHTSEASMIMSLLPVLLLSVALILDFCFHHKLVKEPVTVNPVSLIFKVLKYAAKHKYPVQRSAFTYCENEQPTRLDYGKSKYGGPFTTEQVEDVKTFWRILLVILVISLFFSLITEQFESAAALLEDGTNCTIEAVDFFQASSTIMFYIPLYEIFIQPCLRNRGPSILQSLGIGAATAVISSIYGTITEVIQKIITNGAGTCMFLRADESIMKTIVGIAFNCIVGVAALILIKSSIEFVCAQSPYNVNSLLIGLLFTMGMLFTALGTVYFEAWKHKWLDILDTSTCGIWFYLTTLVLAVVSSVILGLVIRWYKARERDEIPRSQTLVEDIYYKYQQQGRQD